jgi:small subunit ribosomal protein S1
VENELEAFMVEEKLLIDDMSMSDLLAGVPEKVKSGSVVSARVLGKTADGVLVDLGLKMEGLIPRAEFHDFDKALPFQEGDTISVFVRQVEGQDAHTKVSWRAAREFAAWDKLADLQTSDTPIEGTVQRKVKGGFVVDIGVDAFLPGSQMDVRPSRDPDVWLGRKISVLITEMDRSKSNVVVSRRKLLERERTRLKEQTMQTLAEGQICKGTVTSITNFGAFVDIGGIEGLLHISDLSWHRTDPRRYGFKSRPRTGRESFEVRCRDTTHFIGPEATSAPSLGRRELAFSRGFKGEGSGDVFDELWRLRRTRARIRRADPRERNVVAGPHR